MARMTKNAMVFFIINTIAYGTREEARAVFRAMGMKRFQRILLHGASKEDLKTIYDSTPYGQGLSVTHIERKRSKAFARAVAESDAEYGPYEFGSD